MTSSRQNKIAASARSHRSSFARSLSSIHLDKTEDLLSHASRVSDQDSSVEMKRSLGGKKSRRKSCNDVNSIKINRSGGCLASPSTSSSLIGSEDLLALLLLESPALPFAEDEKQPQRESSPEQAPLRQLPSASSVENHDAKTAVQKTEPQHKGFREDYRLGEAARSPSHMIMEPTSERAIEGVNSLQKHDYAFVRRSDGSYSYAILACRSFEPVKGGTEECMTFIVNANRSTKTARKSQWSSCMHLVSMDRSDPLSSEPEAVEILAPSSSENL